MKRGKKIRQLNLDYDKSKSFYEAAIEFKARMESDSDFRESVNRLLGKKS